MTDRDIIERLRFSAAVNRSGGYDGDAEEREEAAAEIGRLRAICAQYAGGAQVTAERITLPQAEEIERLRNALAQSIEATKEQLSEIEQLRGALECLLPGLMLDLRYAKPDDDIDALQSRVRTVCDALAARDRYRAPERVA